MTIFVTGASGMVGSAFVRAAARRGHEVTAIVGRHTGPIEGAAECRQVDLSDEMATVSAVLDVFPQAIVNCAAIAAPADCDANPSLAHALNVTLPATLARLAHHVSARLVHVSSEQVFDGARTTPYSRGDEPRPINLYGRQKLESERLVHERARDFAVTIRAPLLLGNSLGGGRSLHEKLLAGWSAGSTPRLYTDEFRQPCTAENLAEVLLELCERDEFLGVFHWGGAEVISRHELGVRIREHFKLPAEHAPIEPVSRDQQPEEAGRRQPHLALNLAPLAGRLKTRPQTIDEQLEELKLPAPVRPWYFGLSRNSPDQTAD